MENTIDITRLRLLDGNKVAVYQDLGLYEGLIPIQVDKMEDPILHWKGSPIHTELWMQIVSFMKWTNKKYDSEAQLRLYYNEDMDVWDVAVLPQHVETGLSSKEIPDHAGREKVFARFDPSKGWREAGTVHHHCSSSAFQSGTDLNDEKEKNGLHITLGDMEQNEEHGFHARASFRRVMYEVVPTEWIEGDFGYYDKDKRWGSPIKAFSSSAIFPEEWKEFLIPKPKSVHTTFRGTGCSGYAMGVGFHSGWDPDDYNWYNSRYASDHSRRTNTAPPIQTTFKELEDDDVEIIDWQRAIDLEEIEEIGTDILNMCKVLDIEPTSFGDAVTLLNFVDSMRTMLNALRDVETYGLCVEDTLAWALEAHARRDEVEESIDTLNSYSYCDDLVEDALTLLNGDRKNDPVVPVSEGSQPAFADNFVG